MQDTIQQNISSVQPQSQKPILIPIYQSKIALVVILGLVGITVSVFIGIQIGKNQTLSQQAFTQNITQQPSPTSIPVPTPSPDSISNENVALEKNNVINAGLYIPTINNKFSDAWTAYINWDYNFSFLFPAKWQIDLTDDHMQVKGLMCSGCGGGYSGISITYQQNPSKLPLNNYISEVHSDLVINNLELYTTKNTNITAYIDRQTPGAGPGQTAYIANNKNTDVVELYCGNCSDIEMNSIVSTFDFEVERDQKASWTSFQ